MQLSSGISETGNHHIEDLHDEKMKLSRDSSQYGREKQDQEQNEENIRIKVCSQISGVLLVVVFSCQAYKKCK